MSDEYNVNNYTESQLLSILNLNDPSDRELEAQILTMIRKYENMDNESGDKLAKFFSDIYDFFFEPDTLEEGFQTIAEDNKPEQKVEPPSETANSSVVQLTKSVEYPKDNLNPILKQTIKRVISIDSQYRDFKSRTPSTSFTFNLSEPLKDVVALSLYSIQIPYTWYTVNGDFGGNFFYLKGNTEGINNGSHDYQISVPPGNYNADGLVAAINQSIYDLSTNRTEMNFGNTRAVYNGGTGSNTSGTCKAQLYINIKKVFHESNYYLDFSSNWCSPLSYLVDGTNNSHRLDKVGGYLGFNFKTQSCCSVYSNYFSYDVSNRLHDTTSCVVNQNGTFNIYPYIGNSYQTPSKIYDAITIQIPDGTYTRRSLVNTFDELLRSNNAFDENNTYCSLIDVSGLDTFNIAKYRNGCSFIQISCNLNPTYTPQIENLKLAAVFDISYIFADSSYNLNNSYFKINNTTLTLDGLNYVCEFNTINADTDILQSSYTISSDTYTINYTCIAPGYTDSSNDYILSNLLITNKYSLSQYINIIQKSIDDYRDNNPNKTINNTKIQLDSTIDKLKITSFINTNFTTSQYQIEASGNYFLNTFSNSILDLSSSKLDLSNKNIFTKQINFSSSVTLDRHSLIISPKPNSGINNSEKLIINFDGTHSKINLFQEYLQNQISSIQDESGRTPLANSTVVYNSN
jgi:hypothetical protein